ncbi:uncharacterized protein F4812DRAFT_459252 [Daldinia caldariorum]|uniref:uncharacterized protein n=1 Tax=Daldinia caldariorum TaxID=326644 RepID=UPI002007B9DF|nr:uncharacterized protein F4812DRAFT_459252 [Daldinia caldariorum]KAI1467970.1 hypothetical protein F4812DRAFT_459252 [Daldinia caldariorum]
MGTTSNLDERSRREISINGWLIALSAIVYGLRIFVRIRITKSPGLDDVLAGVACFLLMMQSGMDIQIQTGTAPEAIQVRFFRLLTIETLVYFWTIATVRVAILAFLPRIVRDRFVSNVSWAVAAVILAQTIACFIYRLLECQPIADIFKSPALPGLHCAGEVKNNTMMIGHGIVGVIIDGVLLILPIWMICKKMIWSKKMLQIVLVLSVGVCAVVIGSIRLSVVARLDFDSGDLIANMHSLGIWTTLEGHIGLWCGCFPALQPLLRFAPCVSNRFNAVSSINSAGQNKTGTATGPGATRRGCRGSRRSCTTAAAGSESQCAIVLPDIDKPETGTRDADASIV